jgi:hypothetical protein
MKKVVEGETHECEGSADLWGSLFKVPVQFVGVWPADEYYRDLHQLLEPRLRLERAVEMLFHAYNCAQEIDLKPKQRHRA